MLFLPYVTVSPNSNKDGALRLVQIVFCYS
ncbi:hypothetical protein EG68_02163 [Paragonimus skrjabini miyazakii]|uniref:Uncharacterized protein n=1 Tax=Paragonimus skrjabini miyazakii TaxID=59628 RepID=A0A8S9Z9K8_9TREM|nr:hypothetical protein EG68_02163 [Paragonimus skrjabini miyazakii]